MATIAAGIGALMIGSSLATAAFAQMAQMRPGTSQSITQTNQCAGVQSGVICSNTGTNIAGGGGGSTSQSIRQTNECFGFKSFVDCSNTAKNIAK
jgi:hypothetical protein